VVEEDDGEKVGVMSLRVFASSEVLILADNVVKVYGGLRDRGVLNCLNTAELDQCLYPTQRREPVSNGVSKEERRRVRLANS
jgi:hypothetical protein